MLLAAALLSNGCATRSGESLVIDTREVVGVRFMPDELTDMLRELGYEVGMVSIDLALLYLERGQFSKLEALARETAAVFHRIGVERKAEEALDIWRQAGEVTEDLLKNVREIFFASSPSVQPSICSSRPRASSALRAEPPSIGLHFFPARSLMDSPLESESRYAFPTS